MQNTTIHARYSRTGEDGQPDNGVETTKPVTKIAVAGIMNEDDELIEYLTLQEAIDECQVGTDAQQTEIEILADISLSTTVGNIVENQNILLDLNGKTIETTGTDVYVLKNAGKLEIKDSRAYKENEEDEVEEKEGNIVTSTSNTIYNSKNGELNITSGTIQNMGSEKIAIYNTENAVVNMTGGNIIGGEIVGENITGSSKGIFNYENGRVNIFGGAILTTKVGIHNDGNLNTEESPAVLIEGNPTIKTIQSNAISSIKGLTVVKGGFIENPSKTAATPTVINTENSKIIIAGGTIKCGGINAAVYNGLPGSQDEGVIEIRGGNIESSCTAVHNAAKGTIIISGGTITSTEQRGVSCVSQGTVIISDGDNESLPSEYPKITGKTNGADCHGDFIYYDGTIKGMSGKGSAITGVQPVIPEHYRIIKTQESIEDLETHENIDMETAYLSNEYNVTYNYNIPNYFSSEGYQSEKSNYSNTTNETFQFGKVNVNNFKEGDRIKITVDLEITDVVFNENEDYFIIAQGYGNITEWSTGLNSPRYTNTDGTTTCQIVINQPIHSQRAKDETYYMQIRADYIVSGKIKVTNVTVEKISDDSDKYIQTVVYNTTINSLHEHTERGYELDGWYTQPEGGDRVIPPQTITGDVTYYAHWTLSNYLEITPSGEKVKFYKNLSQAMAGVTSGNTIKVLNSTEVTEAIVLAQNKDVTLNLNGKNIDLDSVSIRNEGTLTINGEGRIDSTANNTVLNKGTLVKNGTSTIYNSSTSSQVATLYNTGNLTINDGAVETSDNCVVTENTTGYGCAISNDIQGNVTVNKANIVGKGTGIYSTSDGNVICGSNVSVRAKNGDGIANMFNGEITLNGGEYRTDRTSKSAVSNIGNGTLNINNGAIMNGGNGVWNHSSGTVNINNGIINGSVNYGVRTKSGIVTISGSETVITGLRNGVYIVDAEEGTSDAEVTITSGKIISTSGVGINMEAGTLTLGDNVDSNIANVASPQVIGNTMGIEAISGTFNFYDGIIKVPQNGTNQAISNISIVPNMPEGYVVSDETEVIEGTTYETAVIRTGHTITYDLAEKNDMNQWSKIYPARFEITYDSQTKMNTIIESSWDGWEIIYLPVTTVVGQKYTFSFDYKIPT